MLVRVGKVSETQRRLGRSAHAEEDGLAPRGDSKLTPIKWRMVARKVLMVPENLLHLVPDNLRPHRCSSISIRER